MSSPLTRPPRVHGITHRRIGGMLGKHMGSLSILGTVWCETHQWQVRRNYFSVRENDTPRLGAPRAFPTAPISADNL
jgi:hypothetical protein